MLPALALDTSTTLPYSCTLPDSIIPCPSPIANLWISSLPYHIHTDKHHKKKTIRTENKQSRKPLSKHKLKKQTLKATRKTKVTTYKLPYSKRTDTVYKKMKTETRQFNRSLFINFNNLNKNNFLNANLSPYFLL